jgi:hypothetical protein
MSRRRRTNTGIPGLSFSWRRATGLTRAKSQLSRELGVPLTHSGRQRKAGRSLGCSVILALAGGAALFAHLL